jgi:hypothetical protein
VKQPDFQKFQRFIVICFAVLFLFSIVAVGYVSYKFKDLNQYIDGVVKIAKIPGPKGADGQSTVTTVITYTEGNTGSKGEKGDVGNQGVQGPQGLQGIQGQTGPSGANGQNGTDGVNGTNGKTVFTRQNPITGDYECRYAGDTVWQPESDCV